MWETAFVAMSIALGETEESVTAALASPPRDLMAALKSPDRRMRAKALATALAPIVLELEQAEVSWSP